MLARHPVLWRILAVVTAAVTLGVPLAADAGPEWRSMTDGIGWAPCETIVVQPNPVSGYPAFEEDLETAVSEVNAAVGRELLTVGAPTVLGKDLTDDVFSVSFIDLPPSVAGTAWIAWTKVDGVPQEIVRGDIGLDPEMFSTITATERVGVMIHEIGHALGLAHVGDAHEAMSNGFIYDGDIGPGTTQALVQLYTGEGCTVGRTIADSTDWALPEYGGAPSSVTSLEVASRAGDVGALGTALVGTSTTRRGSGWADVAVVCRDDLFADCLGGAALVGADGPVVFVPGGPAGQLPGTVRSALEGALTPGATVYVLGGDQALSAAVVDALRAHWPDTRRLAGPSRIETAVAVAREVVARRGQKGVAVLARDDNPADAVTGGAAAGARGLPILLTPRGSVHDATAQALADLGVSRTLLLGGTAALEPAVEDALRSAGRSPERVAGRTRSETSVAVARHPDLWARTALGPVATFVGLNGYHDETWALALATAPLAAQEDAPILLTSDTDVATAPADGANPGEPGWYLAHLDVAPGVTSVAVTHIFVGAGRWADQHAAESFRSYLFVGL